MNQEAHRVEYHDLGESGICRRCGKLFDDSKPLWGERVVLRHTQPEQWDASRHAEVPPCEEPAPEEFF
jgi:hypothetical protein